MVLGWEAKYKTAPYLSAQPTFKHMALQPGDVIVMASDGLADARQLSGFTEEEKDALFLALAGAAVGGVSNNGDLPHWERRLGHCFLPRPSEGGNAADWLLQNVLYGIDDILFAREMTIELPKRNTNFYRWQDDISVLVVHLR